MVKDFKSNIEGSIKNQNEVSNEETEVKYQVQALKFKIGKKKESKIDRKQFPLYLDDDRGGKLDKICKKTGYSKNELILMMIDFGLENLELDI